MSAQSLLMEALDKMYGRVYSKLEANRLLTCRLLEQEHVISRIGI